MFFKIKDKKISSHIKVSFKTAHRSTGKQVRALRSSELFRTAPFINLSALALGARGTESLNPWESNLGSLQEKGSHPELSLQLLMLFIYKT